MAVASSSLTIGVKAMASVRKGIMQHAALGRAVAEVAEALAAEGVAAALQRAVAAAVPAGAGAVVAEAAATVPESVTFAEWAANVERLCAQRSPPGGHLYSAAARLSDVPRSDLSQGAVARARSASGRTAPAVHCCAHGPADDADPACGVCVAEHA